MDVFKKTLSGHSELGRGYEDLWDTAYDHWTRFVQAGNKKDISQGWDHCRRVELNLWRLLRKHWDQFSWESLYILTACAALHDIGKLGCEIPDHGKLAYQIIRKDDKGFFHDVATREIVAGIALYHSGGDTSQLEDSVELGRTAMLVHPMALAAIFRMADMMDTTMDRVSVRLIEEKIPGIEKYTPVAEIRSAIARIEIHPQYPTVVKVVCDSEDKRLVDLVFKYVVKMNAELGDDHKRLMLNVPTTYMHGKTLRTDRILLPHEFLLERRGESNDFDLETPVKARSTKRKVSKRGSGATKSGDGKQRTRDRREPEEASAGWGVLSFPDLRRTSFYYKQHLCEQLERSDEIDHRYLYWGLEGAEAWLKVTNDRRYELARLTYDQVHNALDSLLDDIVDDTLPGMDYVSLGPGDGEKDALMLEGLYRRLGSSRTCTYYPVDFSYHLVRWTLAYLETHMVGGSIGDWYTHKVDKRPFLCDFLQLPDSDHGFWNTGWPKLFALLGSTLGNFAELKLLRAIAHAMSENDWLLIDAELHADRTDDELLQQYSDTGKLMTFLSTPFHYLEGATPPDGEKLRATVEDGFSDIDGSKSVVVRYEFDSRDIVLTKTTKYDADRLKIRLWDSGFQVTREFGDGGRCLLWLLKTRSTGSGQ
ncbi:MAG: L-histidine N(alpha)-methyltransferase [Armatimonadetes bacterium]|nr:L-histidine N(alpha)-methyltransferase [Armatimonadota bacterium]